MTKQSTPLIPDHAFDPDKWAAEAMKRSADYSGMEESTWFLTEARRYLSLHEKIKELQRQISSTQVPPLERVL